MANIFQTGRPLLYIISSFITVLYWFFTTMPENYAWNPDKNELLLIQEACSNIFWFKVAFWLLVINTLIFIKNQLFFNKVAGSISSIVFMALLLVIVRPVINEKCAYNYFQIFCHQSVAEQKILTPIIDSGYSIGKYLDSVVHKEQFKYRRYAIIGLGIIKYDKSVKKLVDISTDNRENQIIRIEAQNSAKIIKAYYEGCFFCFN